MVVSLSVAIENPEEKLFWAPELQYNIHKSCVSLKFYETSICKFHFIFLFLGLTQRCIFIANPAKKLFWAPELEYIIRLFQFEILRDVNMQYLLAFKTHKDVSLFFTLSCILIF